MSEKIKERINNVVLEQLEKWTVPRKKMWSSIMISGTTGKPYQWVNQLVLQCTQMEREYWSNRRLTFNTVKKLWASVKKWEKGTPACYFQFLEKEDEKWETKKIPMLKLYFLFNTDQTTLSVSETQEVDIMETVNAERIRELFESKPKVIQNPQAFYAPIDDIIWMPNKDQFYTDYAYFNTLFHEGTHATSHPTRMDREAYKNNDGFGWEDYSKEELVAEMWASYLCAHAKIDDKTIENSSAYIAWWLKRLQEDKSLLMKASSEAWKCSEFILWKKNWQED